MWTIFLLLYFSEFLIGFYFPLRQYAHGVEHVCALWRRILNYISYERENIPYTIHAMSNCVYGCVNKNRAPTNAKRTQREEDEKTKPNRTNRKTLTKNKKKKNLFSLHSDLYKILLKINIIQYNIESRTSASNFFLCADIMRTLLLILSVFHFLYVPSCFLPLFLSSNSP